MDALAVGARRGDFESLIAAAAGPTRRRRRRPPPPRNRHPGHPRSPPRCWPSPTTATLNATIARRRQLATKRKKSETNDRQGSLGFEEKLWAAADLLRNNVDPAEYKHVVLGLIFLKYISDAFTSRQGELAGLVVTPGSDYYVASKAKQEEELAGVLEDPDEYTAASVFWVPHDARWEHIQSQAKDPKIGKIVDAAMDAIEADNPTLKGVLPKIYAKPDLDKPSLGKLIDLVSGVGLGTTEHKAKDTLGRVYEYFLARFASAEGKGGGEFYTPQSVVGTLVELIEPYEGRVYDPCCGSGGMFVQSLKFLDAHGGKKDRISIYGQESNPTTWRLARMNLAIRGIGANLGAHHAATGAGTRCSSMRGSSDAWRRGCIACSISRTCSASPVPTMRGAARMASTRTLPGSR